MTLSGTVAVNEKSFMAAIGNLEGRRERAERGMRLLRVRAPLVIGQVATGSAAQGFLLGNGKV